MMAERERGRGNSLLGVYYTYIRPIGVTAAQSEYIVGSNTAPPMIPLQTKHARSSNYKQTKPVIFSGTTQRILSLDSSSPEARMSHWYITFIYIHAHVMSGEELAVLLAVGGGKVRAGKLSCWGERGDEDRATGMKRRCGHSP